MYTVKTNVVLINMLNRTLQNALSGFIAIILIVFPVSVFAQSASSTTEGDVIAEESVEDVETTSADIENIVIEPAKVVGIYDNYKREKLPDSNKEFNDFVVGPGYFALQVSPGESKTVLLKISNRIGDRKLFQLTTEDITNEGSSGGVSFLGDDIGPYTLKDYISVPYERFYLDNNKRVVVPVTISIPPDAEPGGFYGSILTQIVTESQEKGGTDVAPTAPLISRIGTLFFVTTSGEIERSGSLVDFTTIPDKSIYFNGPIDMGIVFENTGSVHFNPYGTITITNILGGNVGQVELDPWFVMPNSLRTKELSWNREFLFGRYSVDAEIYLGYDDVVETRTLVFWVLPWKLITVVFAGLFIFFLVIRFFVTRFEFKRK